jgi:hypothetical protein
MKLNNLFKTEYKIVPTYSKDNKRNGYVPLSKSIVGWLPLKMYQCDENGDKQEVEAFFKTYEDALTFVKHETTILTNEEISSAKNA